MSGTRTSWERSRPQRARRVGLLALATLLLGADSEARAGDGAEVKPPLVRTVEAGLSAVSYTQGFEGGESLSVRLTAARTGRFLWRLDLGRDSRFGDSGVGIGSSLTRYLPGGWNFGLGLFAGTGDVIHPDYQYDVSVGRAFLKKDNLLATLGYLRYQSNEENRFDRTSLSAVYYAEHWIVGGSLRYEVGQPGDTISRARGLSLTHARYRKRYLGIAIEQGEVAFQLVAPNAPLVDYDSRTLTATYSRYFGQRTGIHARADYADTDVYDVRSIGCSVFREW